MVVFESIRLKQTEKVVRHHLFNDESGRHILVCNKWRRHKGIGSSVNKKIL